MAARRKLPPQAQLMQTQTRYFHRQWRGWHRECRNRICNRHQDRHQPMMSAVKSLSIRVKRKTTVWPHKYLVRDFHWPLFVNITPVESTLLPGWSREHLRQTVISRSGHYICSCESNVCTVWVTPPPPEPKVIWFFHFFSQTVKKFNRFFTHLLYVPMYARLQIFIQLSPTLTKLCHTKHDHPTNFYISLEV